MALQGVGVANTLSWSVPGLKWRNEVEVILLVLLHNKLKKKKGKHKILIDPLLNSKHKRRQITPCLLHLATV